MDDAEVAELLKRALNAVGTAKVPDDLRETAFTTAVRLLSGETSAGGGGAGTAGGAGGGAGAGNVGGGSAGGASTRTGGGGGSTGSELLDRVARELDVDGSVVARVFAEKNDLPELSVKTTRLPTTAARAAYDIALLVMAARQAGGIEEATESATLREACKVYGKFNQSNFSTHMKALDLLVRTEGRGPSAKRTLTKPGREAAAELIKQYANES